MTYSILTDTTKKLKYLYSFMARRMAHLNLQIIYQCNFKCDICSFWKAPYKDAPRMSLEQIRIVAQKLKSLGPQMISIGGGEPLLHKDIVKIAQTLSQDNFAVMITNGWFMTDEMAAALWQAGLYEISVSVDFADAERHDALRHKEGAWERAIAALETLHKNRCYPHQRVNMIATVFEGNIDHIERLIQLSAKMGISFLVSCYSPNRGEIGPAKTQPDYSAILLDLKARYRHFVSPRGYLARFSDALANGVGNCMAGRNLFNIDTQGNVTRCIDKLDQPAGNIFEEDIRQIQKRLNAQHAQNQCQECWTSCRGPIETIMYGKDRIKNIYDYFHLTRDVSIGGSF
jgi:radical SAM protein with 4Fe4S-binding SPASM domain